MNESSAPDQPTPEASAENVAASRASSLFRKVEEHPLEFIAGAFLLGFAAALSIPRQDQNLRERFVDGPLDEVKDLLHDVLVSVQKNASHVAEAAESQAAGAAKKIKSALHGCC